MPEGPSLVILKELVAAQHLEGKVVKEVVGTTDLDKQRMVGEKVLAFKTWGKHFLICFNGFTVRIHLMFFGSYRINDHKDVAPKLGLKFENAELNFYSCDLLLLEGKLDDIYNWKEDLMSEKWDEKLALKKMQALPNTLVCDALLDQKIFAGVGNIIKNEALYLSKVHPLNKIEDIPLAKLKNLTSLTRAYAFDFLKWKKENTLSKHWTVYSQKTCPKKHDLIKAQLGKNKRVTYYCETCQKQYH